MKLRDILSFTVFGAIIVFAIGYIGSFGIRIGPPANRIDLSMAVSDINGLVVDSNVLLRGVPVGKVTKIATTVDRATIHFYIDGDHRVPVDSDVRLDNLSALGETYIGLKPRTNAGPMLANGQRIDTESITLPPSISELATSVVRVLNQLDPGQLKRIVTEADAALPDPVSVLPNLSHASTLLRNTSANMHGRGQEMLDNFQTLLRDAGFVGPALARLAPSIQELGPTLHHVNDAAMKVVLAGNPENLKLFKTLTGRIQDFLDNRAPDIKVLTEALLPKFQGISGALMNFDTGQILANALDATPEEGAITLHVTIPEG